MVLSPALFTVYVQELLDQLQSSGMGCHVGYTFLGAVAWADDFLQSAPSRSSMQSMLDLASPFAREVGLEFSKHPDPAKSKSKAIYVIGQQTDLEKPAPLILSGQDLPWVPHATHLGHKFHGHGHMHAPWQLHWALLRSTGGLPLLHARRHAWSCQALLQGSVRRDAGQAGPNLP